MSRGLRSRSVFQPRPKRSSAPGPKFSTSTSDLAIKRLKRSLPSSVLRLRVRLLLLALSTRKNRLSLSGLSRMLVRATSPPLGSSSLITSAPRKPSICVHAGPAWLCVMSITRMPERAWLMDVSRLGLRPWVAAPCAMKAGPRAGANRHRSDPNRVSERRRVFFDHALCQRVVNAGLVGRTPTNEAAGHQAGAQALVSRSRQDRISAPYLQCLVALERVGETRVRQIGKIGGHGGRDFGAAHRVHPAQRAIESPHHALAFIAAAGKPLASRIEAGIGGGPARGGR